jgi:hypothetical protein
LCDVRERSYYSRKETTNENVVKVKESLNVTVVYWHCAQFAKEIGKLCYLAAFKQEVNSQLLLCAKFGAV